MFYRNSWVEINLDLIKENIKLLKKTSKKGFFAVIKANGYGAGDGPVARAALDGGADYLAVSSLDEAISLRKQEIQAPILILGYVDPCDVSVLQKYQISVPAVSVEWVEEIINYPIQGLKIHMKVDTGMNRIGTGDKEELRVMISKLKKHGAEIEGIFTHFSCSDNPDNVMSNSQYAKFCDIVQSLQTTFKWIHSSNSDATVHYQDNFCNAVRCGLAMFGVTSYPTQLQPCLGLYTKLVHVKKLPAGQPVGYGATYTTQKEEWIGTIPIGYADGWIRKHQGRHCIIEGETCEFVGRICMDQSMILLPHKMNVGAKVELIGPHMPIEQVAKELDTIAYEVMTLLSDRLAKVYIENQQVTRVANPRLDRL